MVCKIFYSSEYIKDCDISKFGEGCEQCVPLLVIGVIILCVIIIFIEYVLLYRNEYLFHQMK
jgi:hypothetical protein